RFLIRAISQNYRFFEGKMRAHFNNPVFAVRAAIGIGKKKIFVFCGLDPECQRELLIAPKSLVVFNFYQSDIWILFFESLKQFKGVVARCVVDQYEFEIWIILLGQHRDELGNVFGLVFCTYNNRNRDTFRRAFLGFRKRKFPKNEHIINELDGDNRDKEVENTKEQHVSDLTFGTECKSSK